MIDRTETMFTCQEACRVLHRVFLICCRTWHLTPEKKICGKKMDQELCIWQSFCFTKNSLFGRSFVFLDLTRHLWKIVLLVGQNGLGTTAQLRSAQCSLTAQREATLKVWMPAELLVAPSCTCTCRFVWFSGFPWNQLHTAFRTFPTRPEFAG